MSRFQRIAFFLLLASIPIQLGKHFWPQFSFVQGIRIDYLSPTFYLSDLFFIFLFFSSIKALKTKVINLFKTRIGIFLLVSIMFSTLLSTNIQAAIYGVIKLSEFIYIGIYVASEFRKKDGELALFVLTLSALVETVILLFQFLSQHSLGGAFYYLGERTFGPSTPGIATFQFFSKTILRPYGTFPHPNVLAFFLLFVATWLLFSLRIKKNILTAVKVISLVFLSLAICITFSRIVILLWVGIVIYYSYRKVQVKGLFLFGFTLFLLGFFLYQRFEESFIKDILLRSELVGIGLKIFNDNPFFGVGLNNFFYSEVLIQKTVSPILLQPVHNVFLLWVCQTGLLGLVPLWLFVKNTITAKLTNKDFGFLIILFWCILFAGLFDHYFLTLQQGQLMTAIIIGFVYSKQLAS